MVRPKQLAIASSLALMSPASLVLNGVDLPLSSRLVTQFDSNTWIENLAARSNGDLLLTVLAPTASLYGVANPASDEPSLKLLHTFGDGAAGLVGIAEPEPDLFVVAGYGVAANGTTAPVWTVDLRAGGVEPEVQLVRKLENAGVLNGITAVPGVTDAVLVADSKKGLIWRVDLKTGNYEVGVEVEEMKPGSGASSVGVNGVHVRDGYLYWTNSATVSIYRIEITDQGFPTPCARVELVSTLEAVFVDDFVIGEDNTIWVATNSDNRLIATQPFTNQSVVVYGATDTLALAGDTSAIFGRGESDQSTLYVATCGGMRSPINGTLVEPGKVVAVDTTDFRP
ncbi:hypothetical protein GGR57DRAFT_483426 [Xylariaceae sp. FL1272]|nr:hypothetical protein GGR57DRAFT_483426 [Xylariaceae sp. FL1272]